MTSPPWPSGRASAPLAPLCVAVVAVALLLSLPASSFAGSDTRAAGSQTEQGESSETALASAGLLSRGSGYDNLNGSKAVRELQLRLRRLGHRPGPIDGLFGPLTEASVERFQRARALEVDGLVGPRTRARLLTMARRRPAAPRGSATPKPRAPAHPAPNRPAPADVAPPRDHAPDAIARPPALGPESSEGMEPWLAAALGALATGVLFACLLRLGRPRRHAPAAERRRPSTRSRPNLGMAVAVLLAVFAMGAAIGALFATHAAPGDRGGAEVAGGAVLLPPASPIHDAKPVEPPRGSRPATAARPHPRRPPSRPIAATPTPAPVTGKLPKPRGVPGPYPADPENAPSATSTAPPVAPADRGGDQAVARRVKRLLDLNLEDRIAAGDPELLTAGEQQRLP